MPPSDNPKYPLYRVIGVRHYTGLRVPMGFGLTSDEAERIRNALFETKVFATVRTETGKESGATPATDWSVSAITPAAIGQCRAAV